MKRFYKLVSTHQTQNGFEIHLDGRAVKTPMRETLNAPTQGLANAIMEEWAAQGDDITPDTMPITQILSTRLDRVAHERGAMEPLILAYLDTDLVCYRTEKPDELRARQDKMWGVSLSWFEAQYGGVLKITDGLAALSQAPVLHDAVGKFVKSLDDDYFTILQLVCAASGSLVLALAFVNGAVDEDHIFEAVRIEESYKAEIYDAEKYGPDPAQEKKDKALLRDLNAAAQYLSLID